MKKICVVGSINLDYITLVERFPETGETIFGDEFTIQPGGKGANQAVAAAKLNGEVSFIGACGNDSIYNFQLDNFKKYNIDVSGIESVDTSSGIAQITVSNGENSIIVVPGANNFVTEKIIKKHKKLIEESEIILLQQEIPEKTVEYVVNIASQLNKIIILNPAPSRDISKNVLNKVTFLTPNEIEIKQLFNMDFIEVLNKYPNKIIMTKGKDGVFFNDGNNLVRIDGHIGETFDTTGAGDTFNGAFAVAISEGKSIIESVRFANFAAFKSIQKIGAQAAMPFRKEME